MSNLYSTIADLFVKMFYKSEIHEKTGNVEL